MGTKPGCDVVLLGSAGINTLKAKSCDGLHFQSFVAFGDAMTDDGMGQK